MKKFFVLIALLTLTGCQPEYDIICGNDGSVIKVGPFQDASKISLKKQTCVSNGDGSFTVKFK